MRVGLPVPLTVFAIALLASCASQPPAPSAVSSTQGSTLVRFGRVTDVRDVTVRGGRSSGLGGFVGAVLGGVAGSQIGSGYGSAAAGIGGALAGGMAGQHIEQSGASKSTTELSVQFENGDVRSYSIEPGESFRIGDTVKVTTSRGITRVTH